MDVIAVYRLGEVSLCAVFLCPPWNYCQVVADNTGKTVPVDLDMGAGVCYIILDSVHLQHMDAVSVASDEPFPPHWQIILF